MRQRQPFDPKKMARRLIEQNPDRDDWNEQITNMAGFLGMPEDEVRCEIAGFWDKDRTARLKLVDPAIWTQLEAWYKNRFCKKPRPNSGGYDFTNKTIIYGRCHPIQQAFNNHLNTVAQKALMDWRRDPHEEKFTTYAGHFNTSANILNSQANVEIPMAKTRMTPIKREPTLAYTQGLFFCTLSGMSDLVLGCPETPWIEMLRNLQDQRGHIDLEAVKSSNPEIYNQLTTFHMNQKIVLHRKSKARACTIPKKFLGELADMFITQLRSGLNTVTLNTDLKEFAQIQNVKGVIWAHQINDPYLRCPCFSPHTKTQCTACFNVKDGGIIEGLHTIFDQVPEVQDKAKALYDEIHRVTSLPARTYRTHPVCPRCHTQLINEEAIRNQSGANPVARHPTDVKCHACEHEFCTDCLTSHPGVICRGWEGPYDEENVVQECPNCRTPTDRTEGCAFIQCGVPGCHKMWCWVCRCFRKREIVDIVPDARQGHYCLVIGKAENNPAWRDNPEIKLYESNAPGHRDWVPL